MIHIFSLKNSRKQIYNKIKPPITMFHTKNLQSALINFRTNNILLTTDIYKELGPLHSFNIRPSTIALRRAVCLSAVCNGRIKFLIWIEYRDGTGCNCRDGISVCCFSDRDIYFKTWERKIFIHLCYLLSLEEGLIKTWKVIS